MFYQQFLEEIESTLVKVQPSELGLIRRRYQDMFNITNREMRPRIFEQLTLGVLIWISMCMNETNSTTLDETYFALQTKRDLSKKVEEFERLFAFKPEHRKLKIPNLLRKEDAATTVTTQVSDTVCQEEVSLESHLHNSGS
jgi:hypothetical protein